MNTDPFVFGDEFYYALCRQESVPLLKRLDVGSVILFGSRVNWQFALDTVFVVGKRLAWPHQCEEIYVRTPPVYHRATLDMISTDVELTFYIGATYDKPYNGMFSFVPCAPLGSHPDDFARPVIERSPLFDFIRSGMTQGISSSIVPAADAVRIWAGVADIVTGEGLCLGVDIDRPPII